MEKNIIENTILFSKQKTEMQIFVCEDDASQLKEMAGVINQTAIHNQWKILLEEFSSAETMLQNLEDRKSSGTEMPDVIFTDIEMPGINGIEFGKKVCRFASEIYLIYITAYTEYAICGYETRAYRYLLKPLEEGTVQKVLNQIFCEAYDRKYLLLEKHGKERMVVLDEIVYFSAQDNYTVVHTTEDTYLSRISLHMYEQELEEEGFFRIHRKYLLNMYHYKGRTNNSIIVSGNQELPVSRRKKDVFCARYRSLLETGFFS